MHLFSLSQDLLLCIAEVVHPNDIINFSLVCKRINACCQRAIDVHRRKRREYECQHDRLPMTVINILRQVFENDPNASYITRFEAWGMRPKWTYWRTMDDFMVKLFDPVERRTDLTAAFFENAELDRYRAFISKNLHLGPAVARNWINRIKHGDDEPLRVILYASLPNLRHLEFIHYSWDRYDGDMDKHHPYKLFNKAVESCHRAAKRKGEDAWPPGFKSIREVACGVFSNSEIRHPHDQYIADRHSWAALVTLPNIREFYVSMIQDDDTENDSGEDYEDGDWSDESESSSDSSQSQSLSAEDDRSPVEKLIISIDSHMDEDEEFNFLKRMKNLKSLIYDYMSGATFLERQRALSAVFGQTLQDLDCGSKYPSIDTFALFPRLRRVRISPTPILEGPQYLKAMPATIESFEFIGQGVVKQEEVELFERELTAFILDRTVDPATASLKSAEQNLKGICLANVSVGYEAVLHEETHQKWLDGALGHLCRERGVKLHSQRQCDWGDGVHVGRGIYNHLKSEPTEYKSKYYNDDYDTENYVDDEDDDEITDDE